MEAKQYLDEKERLSQAMNGVTYDELEQLGVTYDELEQLGITYDEMESGEARAKILEYRRRSPEKESASAE